MSYSYQESIYNCFTCRIYLILINSNALKWAMIVFSKPLPSDSITIVSCYLPVRTLCRWQHVINNSRIHLIQSRRTCLSAWHRTAVPKSACFNVIWRIEIDGKGRNVEIRNLSFSSLPFRFTFLHCLCTVTKTFSMSLNERHYEWDKMAYNGNATANTPTVPAVDDDDDDQHTD
jgi:hypothetical protein